MNLAVNREVEIGGKRMQIFWSLTAIFSLITIIFILIQEYEGESWTLRRTTSINQIASRLAKRAEEVKSAAHLRLQQKLNPPPRHDKGDESDYPRE
jgi:hypothetical protein